MNNKQVILDLVKWVPLCVAAGLLLIQFLPSIYGWVTGNVIGGLFANFLAKHDTLFWWTEQVLGFGYLLLGVGGLDLLFLMMVYIALNKAFESNGSRKDCFFVALRALRGLLAWQLAVFILFMMIFGKKWMLSIYSFVPPFLTGSFASSCYMMVWELSLLWFALAYALMEDGLKAGLLGMWLFFSNSIISVPAAFGFVLITWLPAVCLGGLNLPPWVLLIVGLALHAIAFQGVLLLILKHLKNSSDFSGVNI